MSDTPTTPTARAATLRAEIASLLDWMELELGKDEEEAATWPGVGSLTKVKDDLMNTLEFLSGVDKAAIQENLDDLHL
jgi:hypothetical protein